MPTAGMTSEGWSRSKASVLVMASRTAVRIVLPLSSMVMLSGVMSVDRVAIEIEKV
jgi:ATP-dependent protease ClpP protease subunit